MGIDSEDFTLNPYTRDRVPEILDKSESDENLTASALNCILSHSVTPHESPVAIKVDPHLSFDREKTNMLGFDGRIEVEPI